MQPILLRKAGFAWTAMGVLTALVAACMALGVASAQPSEPEAGPDIPVQLSEPEVPPGVPAPLSEPEVAPGVPAPPSEPDGTPTPQNKPMRVQPRRSTPESAPPATRLSGYRPSRYRLARLPNMFGDLPSPMSQVLFNKLAGFGANGMADLPLGGASRRMKIAENNKALPMDRIYFAYNHFHNGLSAQNDPIQPLPGNGQPTGLIRRSHVERYLLGFEKTFRHELWSVDVRMPLSSGPSFDDTGIGFGVFGEEIGNMNVALKRVLHACDCCALTAGLGIDIPTGSNVVGIAQGEPFTIHNDAVYLQPFLGCLGRLNDRVFYHGFLQADIGANGNRIDLGNVEVGVLQEQNLMHFDLSAGYWIHRNRRADFLTGLAGLLEFHYTTTLQDTDRVAVGDVFNPQFITPNFLFYNRYNRLDIANLTVGLHMELAGQTTLRIGGALPLDNRPNRLFDAEVMVQLNRYF